MIKLYSIFTAVILASILVFVYRLFFLLPSSKRMFKTKGMKDRVSMSYVIMFDIYTVSKIIKKKMEKQKNIPVYISAYGIRREFFIEQSLYEIEKTLRDFQYEIIRTLGFNTMHYKTSYEHMLECWVINSKYKRYRTLFLRHMFSLYGNGEIRLITLLKMLAKFSGIYK